MRQPEDRRLPSVSPDDSHLIALLRSGDPVAFETVFRANAAALCELANSYVRSRDTAEEIVQEFFTWLWVNRHEFLPPYGLRAYLFGAVRNRSLNVIRNEATTSRALTNLLFHSATSAAPADADLMAADLDAAVRETVEAMPPRCREVFTLLRTQALSYADVAAILGIAPKTVEVHITRALAILRARLGPWLNG